MNYFTLFLTNNPEDFQAEHGLTSMPGHFSDAILQIEFARTITNSKGDQFTPSYGRTPFGWLEKQDITPWAYVNPVNPRTLKQLGGWVEMLTTKDPYWFRRRQARMADNTTAPSPIFDQEYRAQLADMILNTGVTHVYLDEYDPHRYYRKDREEIMVAYKDFARRLYSTGIKVLANGGWQPDSMVDEIFNFPLASILDGILIEYPAGMSEWDGGWTSLMAFKPPWSWLRRIAEGWEKLGKQTWFYAPYSKNSPYYYQPTLNDSFMAHAQAMYEEAKRVGITHFATGDDTGSRRAPSRTWWMPFFEVEDQTSDPPPPPPPPPPHHDENEIDALSNRVASLEKDVAIIKAMI